MCVFSPQVWDFETIDNADITEENTVFEMEPLTEIKVSTTLLLHSLHTLSHPHTHCLTGGK